MSTGFSVLIAIAVTVLLGGLFTAYLWLIRRRQAETAAGIAALSAMRWRELARLVIEALQAKGFTAESIEQTVERGSQADLRLLRDGRPWLLACKQGGMNYRVGQAAVLELAGAVRFHNAAGGILATPGRIEPQARKAATGIDLYDGSGLWALVSPLLPASLHQDLTASARRRSVRETGLVWVAAVVLGVGAGLLLPLLQNTDTQAPIAPAATTTAPPPSATPSAADTALTAPAPADPNREQFERSEVIRTVGALPGIERVLWSTQSTLVVHQRDDGSPDPVQPICAILGSYDSLRVSRLQLQPPPGSGRTVRFLQCRSY